MSLVNEISMLMAYEVTRDLKTDEVEIETPLQKTVYKQNSKFLLCYSRL